MAIAPDTKDWTWVLDRPCPDCGFDTRAITAADVASLAHGNAAVWRRVLTEREEVRLRPSDDRWSVLEYACHVRDVLRLADRRIAMMVTEDHPTFSNWDQDATAVSDRYDAQDPAVVADEIDAAAAVLARAIDTMRPEAWARSGTRSDGAPFTVESFARYVIHDPVHHLHDIGAD